jgi:hypothetical protein
LKKTFDFVFQIVELPLLFYPFWALMAVLERTSCVDSSPKNL